MSTLEGKRIMQVVHAIYTPPSIDHYELLSCLDRDWFCITFESPNMIQTSDGTKWNRDGIATESEKKLQDENQALRDQVALLEEQIQKSKPKVYETGKNSRMK